MELDAAAPDDQVVPPVVRSAAVLEAEPASRTSSDSSRSRLGRIGTARSSLIETNLTLVTGLEHGTGCRDADSRSRPARCRPGRRTRTRSFARPARPSRRPTAVRRSRAPARRCRGSPRVRARVVPSTVAARDSAARNQAKWCSTLSTVSSMPSEPSTDSTGTRASAASASIVAETTSYSACARGRQATFLEASPLQLRRRQQPERAIDRHERRRHRRPLRDDERRGRQRADVLDHHRAALDVERHREQLLGRAVPALGRRECLPALRRLDACRKRAVAMDPRPRVSRVQAQAVTAGETVGDRRLADAGWAADPERALHRPRPYW